MDPAVVSKVAARLAGARIWGKLATHPASGHEPPMRRLVTLAPLLLLAACAPRVAQHPTPTTDPTRVVRPTGGLFGVTATDLIARFGQPSFQVREGAGTKLQWSENGCVLDAYLYPPPNGQGVPRVAHVDARNPSGVDVDVDRCLSLIAR